MARWLTLLALCGCFGSTSPSAECTEFPLCERGEHYSDRCPEGQRCTVGELCRGPAYYCFDRPNGEAYGISPASCEGAVETLFCSRESDAGCEVHSIGPTYQDRFCIPGECRPTVPISPVARFVEDGPLEDLSGWTCTGYEDYRPCEEYEEQASPPTCLQRRSECDTWIHCRP